MSRPTGARGGEAPLVRRRLVEGGRHISWTAAGEGPALLVLPGWVSHLSVDWSMGPVGDFHRALAGAFRVIRYDPPGVGMSAEEEPDFSRERQLADLAAVVDACAEERVILLASGLAGPLALLFAARYGDRVSRLVLFGTAPSFTVDRDHPDGLADDLPGAVERLVRADWHLGSRLVAELLLPGTRPEEVRWYADYQRMCAQPEAAAALFLDSCALNAWEELGAVAVPTLLLRREDSYLCPAAVARRMVEALPEAVGRTLPGGASLPYFTGPDAVLAELTAFANPGRGLLTDRELAVIGRARDGLSNRAIARTLGISEHTAARHLANINVKLGVNSRGMAVARAMELALI
ncbi:alpha/beta fold hydrolase [Kitasatospora sp. NPDC048194]|uniref:alpha/beta fold hydrolase n=1 Tax=Kitasatospora sp. NPDC048194 TaxID=3364045 RepID=UPI003710C4B8